MSNLSSLPISEVIKKGKELEQAANDEPQPKRSRSEVYKKAKELEEARKAGDAPALVDEEGRDINPHIPQYISSVPFFYNTNHPTLKHQRSYKANDRQPLPVSSNVAFQRGVKIQAATKWRPGACENCGAMDHKRKDCMERPRKVGARFTNKNIAPDTVIPPNDECHSYESKRDRWSGYHPDDYKQTIEEYKRVEEAQRRLKESSLKREAEAAASNRMANDSEDDDDDDDELAGPSPGDCDTTNKPQTSRETGDVDLNDDDSLSDDSDDDDDDKYADKADMPGTKVDSKQRITVRNLRIREDTAKYLINLDPNSAYYDPKTRSMRENPLPAGAVASSSTTKAIAVDDNFVRYSGDVTNYNKARRFAWEASEKGVDVHLEALPTKTAIIQKEFESKKKEYDERVSKYIEETYGPNLAQPASELHVSQSERYVEFSRTGRVLCGPSRLAPPSSPGRDSSSL